MCLQHASLTMLTAKFWCTCAFNSKVLVCLLLWQQLVCWNNWQEQHCISAVDRKGIWAPDRNWSLHVYTIYFFNTIYIPFLYTIYMYIPFLYIYVQTGTWLYKMMCNFPKLNILLHITLPPGTIIHHTGYVLIEAQCASARAWVRVY